MVYFFLTSHLKEANVLYNLLHKLFLIGGSKFKLLKYNSFKLKTLIYYSILPSYQCLGTLLIISLIFPQFFFIT